MMTDDEIIAVVQAHKVGKVIEWSYKAGTRWQQALSPVWNFDSLDYRVKPEPPKPREFWIEERFGYVHALHNNLKPALREGSLFTHVREVLGE